MNGACKVCGELFIVNEGVPDLSVPAETRRMQAFFQLAEAARVHVTQRHPDLSEGLSVPLVAAGAFLATKILKVDVDDHEMRLNIMLALDNVIHQLRSVTIDPMHPQDQLRGQAGRVPS